MKFFLFYRHIHHRSVSLNSMHTWRYWSFISMTMETQNNLKRDKIGSLTYDWVISWRRRDAPILGAIPRNLACVFTKLSSQSTRSLYHEVVSWELCKSWIYRILLCCAVICDRRRENDDNIMLLIPPLLDELVGYSFWERYGISGFKWERNLWSKESWV